MVTCERIHGKRLIILQPNRSASWATNLRVIYAMTVFSFLVAGGFALLGAWMVLPFAGLEMLALSAALYWVSWKQQYRHVLHFTGNELLIEKGVYYPKRRWRWQSEASRILVTAPRRHLEPLQISLCCGGEEVRIGDFLGQDESRALLEVLREQGLRVGHYAPASAIEA